MCLLQCSICQCFVDVKQYKSNNMVTHGPKSAGTITYNKNNVEVIGFYFDGKKAPIDKCCNFPEGGNFWEEKLTIKAPPKFNTDRPNILQCGSSISSSQVLGRRHCLHVFEDGRRSIRRMSRKEESSKT